MSLNGRLQAEDLSLTDKKHAALLLLTEDLPQEIFDQIFLCGIYSKGLLQTETI